MFIKSQRQQTFASMIVFIYLFILCRGKSANLPIRLHDHN